jgi:hypothetical protein
MGTMRANDYARGYGAIFRRRVAARIKCGTVISLELQAWDREPKKIAASTLSANQI